MNPKGSGFFSSTPLTPEKAQAAMLIDTEGAISTTIIGMSTGTIGFNPNGNITSSNISGYNYDLEKNLTEYKKKVSDLHSENLKLETQLNDAKKKLIKGKTPLIEAEAKLKLLRDALLSVKTIAMDDGSVLVEKNGWDTVLEALAASLHDGVALDSLLAKHIMYNVGKFHVKASKSKKSKVFIPDMDKFEPFTAEEFNSAIDEGPDTPITPEEMAAIKAKYVSTYNDLVDSIKAKPNSIFNEPDDDVPF